MSHSDSEGSEAFEDALEDTQAASSSSHDGPRGSTDLSDSLEDASIDVPDFDPATVFAGSRFEGLRIADDAIIADTKRGEDLFLTNKFEEAKKLFEPYAQTSLYHSLGYSTVLSVRAVMTMEQEDIQAAFKQLKMTVGIAAKYKKKDSFMASMGKMIKGSKYRLESLTKEELHAELGYAESTLMKGMGVFWF